MMWSDEPPDARRLTPDARSSNPSPPMSSIPPERMHGLAIAATAGSIPVERTSDADRQLAERCATGDVRAFEEIYSTWGERMKSIAYNPLGNISDAEDAVQETLLKIHRAASTYAGDAAFSTWLYRV